MVDQQGAHTNNQIYSTSYSYFHLYHRSTKEEDTPQLGVPMTLLSLDRALCRENNPVVGYAISISCCMCLSATQDMLERL